MSGICESCGKRPGDMNSSYMQDDDYDEGIWVCYECEKEAGQDFEVWSKSVIENYETVQS